MDEHDILEEFRKKKIMTIEDLRPLLQSSTITVRRRLKKWGTLTSINQNGRYYTLPEIPEFDGNGLWKYQLALFSRHGNLRQAIIELIKRSEQLRNLVPKGGTFGFDVIVKVGVSLFVHSRSNLEVMAELRPGMCLSLNGKSAFWAANSLFILPWHIVKAVRICESL